MVLSICLTLASCGDSKRNDLRFDSGTWKEGDPRVRYQMKADLIKNDSLIGKTRSEIIDMLGPGDRDPNQRAYIQYEIDNGRLPSAILVSRVYLTLIFDDSGEYVKDVTVADG